ncbi:hypothetical protein LJR175_008219 [Variovorax sp. LjRoot175]|uniref:hypothetical protein n=1 Tax=Variovorax sp. LjRoot175 TaxID=3342276 RepID=UPI003ECFABC2
MSAGASRALLDVFDAVDEGRFDDAARLASDALDKSPLERTLLSAMVAYVDSKAVLANRFTAAVGRLLRKATDRGFHEFAYNAANKVMESARKVSDYEVAARYYQIAMAFGDEPRTQAAAHVNFCPIVRDGLITGEKDWPGAVEIYEKAAKMGLIKGMANAGNVCLWLTSAGREAEYGDRAARWFVTAIDHFEERRPRVDMESDAELEEVITNCRLNLAGMDIDRTYSGASLDRGISVVQELARLGHPIGKDYLRVGLRNRLEAIAENPGDSPGANWRIVLTALGWTIDEEIRVERYEAPFARRARGRTRRVDRLLVELESKSKFPLLVVHDPCIPQDGGIEMLRSIAEQAQRNHPDGFFLLCRKAYFIENEGSIYTMIFAQLPGRELYLASLWDGATPDELVQQYKDGVQFGDPAFGEKNCMISIAVNALDEGLIIAQDASRYMRYVEVGSGLRMPFVREENLLDLGIVLA